MREFSYHVPRFTNRFSGCRRMMNTPDSPPIRSRASILASPVIPLAHPSTIATFTTVALAIIAVAAAWFMMQQLASILRPFFIAVFLAYVLMPYHSRLRKHIRTGVHRRPGQYHHACTPGAGAHCLCQHPRAQ